MTRTEQFLEGYDSCRREVQQIVATIPKLRENEFLYHLACFPYYEKDGQDWHPLCHKCKYYDYDFLDHEYCCVKNNVKNIENDVCKLREEEEAK